MIWYPNYDMLLIFLHSLDLNFYPGTYIEISLREVITGVVTQLECLVIADQGIPIMTEVELLIGTACRRKEHKV